MNLILFGIRLILWVLNFQDLDLNLYLENKIKYLKKKEKKNNFILLQIWFIFGILIKNINRIYK